MQILIGETTLDLSGILQALITLAATLVTSFLIPCIKEKLTLEKQEKLKKWTEIAVAAAEAPGTKCPRCWVHSEEANEDGLCKRCAAVVAKIGE